MSAISPHVSEKALREFAFRVLIGAKDELRPETTTEEIMFFVDTLPAGKLMDIYMMFYRTGLVV